MTSQVLISRQSRSLPPPPYNANSQVNGRDPAAPVPVHTMLVCESVVAVARQRLAKRVGVEYVSRAEPGKVDFHAARDFSAYIEDFKSGPPAPLLSCLACGFDRSGCRVGPAPR